MRQPAGGARRAALAAVLAVVVVVCAGCQVDVEVAVEVDDDGTGAVEVAVALDEAAAGRVPELADQLEVGDLEAAGWQVTGPAEEGDGRTWVRAAKGFDRPEQAAAVLAEVGGPLQDLRVERDPNLLEDRWRFTGTVDLTEGLAAFSDDALRERLDGTDVGWTADELAASAGRPLEDALGFRVSVELPGDVASVGGGSGEGAAWTPALGERVELAAVGRRPNVTTSVWLSLSTVAAVAFLARCVTFARRRRHQER